MPAFPPHLKVSHKILHRFNTSVIPTQAQLLSCRIEFPLISSPQMYNGILVRNSKKITFFSKSLFYSRYGPNMLLCKQVKLEEIK